MEINENILHPIDFEYNHRDNDFLNLVCVAVDNKRFWLNNNEELGDFQAYMKSIEGGILVCHAASLAEIPCCIKAGINVDRYCWFDTFVTEKRLRAFNGKIESSLSLIEVLKSYGIEYGYTSQEKEDLRGIIIDGTNIEYKRFEILDYLAKTYKKSF